MDIVRHMGRLAATMAFLFASAPAALAGEATPAAVAAALPQLDAYIRDAVANGLVPGLSVAVVFDDEVVFLEGYGVREVGMPETVDADTVFQIASLSKPLSSTIVAALVSQGSVSWDSRIADIDPEFRLSEPYPSAEVTIADLFAHRSGLPGNAGNDLEQLGYDRETILERLRLVEPSSSFRAGYSYSNFGLTEGGVAAAGAAGMTWEEAADAMLYAPLGMTSTSSRYADFIARPDRAAPHVWYDGRWQVLTTRMPDAQAPAGGVSSTARDLAQWMRLELGLGAFDGEQLVDQAALARTHLPVMARGIHPITGQPSFYALGWDIQYGKQGEVWTHAGAFSTGARTVVSMLPGERLGIVVLANAFPTGMPDAIAGTFFDLVFEGAPTRDWATAWNGIYASILGPASEASKALYGTPPVDAEPALPLAAYVGTYDNDYIGTAVVAEQDGGLVLKLGPDGVNVHALSHFDRDIFTYFPYAETPDVPYPLSFMIGPHQIATQLMIEDLDTVGFGTLVRQED